MVNHRAKVRLGAIVALFLAALIVPLSVEAVPNSVPGGKPPAIGHVFIIMLENKSFVDSFGTGSSTGADSADSYLRTDLPAMGALLTQYHATSHFSHSNYVTLTSGQPPNAYNQTDCTYYREFESTGIDAEGIAHGVGCVFPTSVKTIADQLDAKGLAWAAYAESMDAYDGPGFTKGPGCRRPETNGYDATYSDEYPYVPRHVPFLYFHSIVDSPRCRSHVVDYEYLAPDLQSIETTPAFSFVVPNTCNDGHQATCPDKSPGGLASINRYLRIAVPMITESPAFKQDGLLLILFDEAELDGPGDTACACCATPMGPNAPSPGGVIPGPGGGRTGAVAISPFIKPGTVSNAPYNHYSTLKTVEAIFGLPPLGYAGRAGVNTFGSDVFTAASRR